MSRIENEEKRKTMMKQFARIRQDRHHVETNGGRVGKC